MTDEEQIKRCVNCAFIHKFNNGTGRYMCELSEDKKELVRIDEGKKRYLIKPTDKACMFLENKPVISSL